jgi:type VI secretion system protein ImpM
MDAQACVPGWFGKIPAAGDFITRRLPGSFVEAWDGWLGRVLPGSEALLGARWQHCYLTAPIWRFALMPSACDAAAWAGVIMPSVDAVQRSFPLTIAAQLGGMHHAARTLLVGSDWYECVEEIALAALEPGTTAEAIDAALLELGGPGSEAGAPADAGGEGKPLWRLSSVDGAHALFRARALAALLEDSGWRTCWWTRGRESGAAGALGLPALPDAAAYAAMLSID